MVITAPITVAVVVLLTGLGAACSLPAIKKRLSRSRTSILPTAQYVIPRTPSSNHSAIQDVPDELPETPPRPVTPAGVSAPPPAAALAHRNGRVIRPAHRTPSIPPVPQTPAQYLVKR